MATRLQGGALRDGDCRATADCRCAVDRRSTGAGTLPRRAAAPFRSRVLSRTHRTARGRAPAGPHHHEARRRHRLHARQPVAVRQPHPVPPLRAALRAQRRLHGAGLPPGHGSDARRAARRPHAVHLLGPKPERRAEAGRRPSSPRAAPRPRRHATGLLRPPRRGPADARSPAPPGRLVQRRRDQLPAHDHRARARDDRDRRGPARPRHRGATPGSTAWPAGPPTPIRACRRASSWSRRSRISGTCGRTAAPSSSARAAPRAQPSRSPATAAAWSTDVR